MKVEIPVNNERIEKLFQQQQYCFADHHLHQACLRKNFTEKSKKIKSL